MRIALGSDRNGLDYKNRIIAHLKELGHEMWELQKMSPAIPLFSQRKLPNSLLQEIASTASSSAQPEPAW